MMEDKDGAKSSAGTTNDLVDVAIFFLINRMRFSKSGYGASAKVLSETAHKLLSRKAHPSYLAIVQAIHEMLWSSTENNFDEEHHTASLMGHVASNLSWCILSEYTSRVMKGESTKTISGLYDIKWAAQSKTSEARTGGDFAIALPGGEGFFKVILFQAKRAEDVHSGSSDVNVYQFRSAKKSKQPQPDGTLQSQSDLLNTIAPELQIGGSADARLVEVMRRYRKLNYALPKCSDDNSCHQLESLLRAERLALQHANRSELYKPNRYFSYYVIWNRRRTVKHGDYFPHPPVCIPAATVARGLLGIWEKRNVIDDTGLRHDKTLTEAAFRFSTNGEDFADLFYGWATNSSNGGMYIPVSKAKSFIGNFASLCPGIDFLVLSDSDDDSGGGKLLESALTNASYKVTTLMDKSALHALNDIIANTRESATDPSEAAKVLQRSARPRPSPGRKR